MHITKMGNLEFRKRESLFNTKGEFFFHCKKCGCEWYADRGDKELHISPPICKFYTYMKCPICDEMTYDREER